MAGVAHDFNNLLAAIGGSIEIAREEGGSSPWLGKAQVATDRASELVQQLLQFSRREEATHAVVDLEHLTRQTVSLMRETIDRRIEIETPPPEPVRVWGDRGQLERVLMNLLVNARDAVTERMERTGGVETYTPKIVVALEQTEIDEREQPAGDAATVYAELSVTDNGVGISPEVRGRVFDPFFSTKPAAVGTGLGLSTAYGIVRDHGGSIEVHSVPDEQTTFTVQLPAATVGSLDDEPEAGGSAESVPGRGERVLVADDEPIVLEVVSEMLTQAGYAASCATGGDGAMRLASDQPFDLILLYINMPAPNGCQTLRDLLKHAPDQRVLMLSGFATEDEVCERGAVGLLRKPFNKEMLVHTVEEALGGRAGCIGID